MSCYFFPIIRKMSLFFPIPRAPAWLQSQKGAWEPCNVIVQGALDCTFIYGFLTLHWHHMPLGVGRGQNVGLWDFCHILTLLPPGHASVLQQHMSSFILQMWKCSHGGKFRAIRITYVTCAIVALIMQKWRISVAQPHLECEFIFSKK